MIRSLLIHQLKKVVNEALYELDFILLASIQKQVRVAHNPYCMHNYLACIQHDIRTLLHYDIMNVSSNEEIASLHRYSLTLISNIESDRHACLS